MQRSIDVNTASGDLTSDSTYLLSSDQHQDIITMADYQRVLEGGVLNGVPPPAESLRWMLTQTERGA